MPRPHPVALRERVVDAYENGEGSYEDIAERFKVGVASVSRWLAQKRRTGSVAPKPAGGNRREPLSSRALKYIRSLVLDEPNWTTTELAEELNEALGIKASRKVIGRALHEMDFTFKRGSLDHQHPRVPAFASGAKPTSPSNRRWMPES